VAALKAEAATSSVLKSSNTTQPRPHATSSRARWPKRQADREDFGHPIFDTGSCSAAAVEVSAAELHRRRNLGLGDGLASQLLSGLGVQADHRQDPHRGRFATARMR